MRQLYHAVVLAAVLALLAAPAWAAQTSYTFGSDTVGQCPAGWTCDAGVQVVAAGGDSRSLGIPAAVVKSATHSASGAGIPLKVAAKTRMTTIPAGSYFLPVVFEDSNSACPPAIVELSLYPDSQQAVAGHYWNFDDYDSCDGSGSVEATATFTFTAGVWYRLRGEFSASLVRLRIWADGDAEPGTWTATTTPGYGNPLLSSLQMSAFNGVVTESDWLAFSIDGSEVTDPQGGGAPARHRVHISGR